MNFEENQRVYKDQLEEDKYKWKEDIGKDFISGVRYKFGYRQFEAYWDGKPKKRQQCHDVHVHNSLTNKL